MLHKGQELRAPEMGLLASIGHTRNILVYKRPVLGLVSTGNELVDVTTSTADLLPGKIRDSNKIMLESLLSRSAQVINLGSVGDSSKEIDAVYSKAMDECDVIVSTGGVSMGQYDLIKPYIESRGQVYFGRLNMKPGKPTTFGRIRDTLVFGLPGNPVSCFVTATLFLEMTLGLLAGSDNVLLK